MSAQAADTLATCLFEQPVGMTVPRETVVRFDETMARQGPGASFPTLFAIPGGTSLTIIAECDSYRKVRDPAGREGWLHQASLKPKG